MTPLLRRRPSAGLLVLLAGTAVLYLWDLSASGYANQFYSAAAQAGSQSWKALFFGSSDAGNSITVDKPPAALWPMGLSIRLFGLHSWSVLVPEALMGVAAVGVLYGTVRRRSGEAAGLLAGAVLALTPVAALMFRFNNPDALLCLLMVCAVACVLRALEQAATRPLLLAGLCFGLGFLTKTLQAWLILPPLALLYAVCAPAAPWRRVRQLLAAGLVMVVSGGWWVAVVELWPAASRPYVGGSQHNSFLELTFGYNGLGRINGNETGSVGGGPGGGGGRWGETGIGRLFGTDMGGQIAWLLPTAFVLLLAGLWITRRGARTDVRRAAFLAWGGALLMTFAVFSFMSGIFHQYYNVALAPYVAALVGSGAVLLWERRRAPAVRVVLAVVVTGTAAWAYVLLGRTPAWLPWLKWAVLAGGVATGALLLVVRRGGAGARAVAGSAVAVCLAAPVAYTLDTVGTAHGGSIVTAGPAVRGERFGRAGGPPGERPRAGRAPRGAGGPGGPFGGARPNGGAPQGVPGGPAGGAGQADRGRSGAAGGMGGLLGGQRVPAAAAAALRRDAGSYTWAAATVGSQNAAGYQLASGEPVMPVGGFNGSDPSPTLRQFQAYVRAGRIHYFIAAVGAPGGRGRGTQGVAAWVAEHFAKTTVAGVTFYDLTAPEK
ncbi:glycosyltransferase family 39 protein [Streptomyces cinnamoneus]|uniref:ArnT family glycosyltransferase n=1 Tax=Streptomyces cinnamoneus TaxID=53446 RepID=UPI0033F1A1C0